MGWVIGQSWVVFTGLAITFTFNFLFTGALALFFFSAFLGSGDFLGEEFLLGKNMLVCGWLPSFPSSSKYCFHFSY